MKKTPSSLTGIGRFGAILCAALGLGAPSASALTSVSLPLGGKEFGNGISINLNSGVRRLDPATSYTFQVLGKCHGTGTNTVMNAAAPLPISLRALLNSFKAGSGNFLFGTYANPAGTFPIKPLNKAYSGSVATPFGPATIKAMIVGGVRGGPLDPTHAGQVYFTITGVSIVPPIPVTVGTLMFDPGARLVITVAP